MALYKHFKRGIFPLLVLSFFFACGNPQENEAREEMQEFETWLDKQSQKTGSGQPQEWQQAKDNYLAFESEMEAKLGALSEDSKEKYHALKTRFKKWEAEVKRMQVTLSADAQTAWQNKLLGQYADTSGITAGNIREAYVFFMGNVRKQYRGWTELDWERTESAHALLDKRKAQVGEDITVADEIKIKALQAEYETLQAGDEVQDAVN